MSTPPGYRGALMTWRVLLLAQLRESPLRLLVTVLAIALGVALGAAVYLVNGAALNEFGLATKRLAGEADILVRGPPEGFPEALFSRLARDPDVSMASPVLELDVALPGRRETLKVLGVDPFRAAALQPALIGDIGGRRLRALARQWHLFEQHGGTRSRITARRSSASHGRQFAQGAACGRNFAGVDLCAGIGADGHRHGAMGLQSTSAASTASTCACSRAPMSTHFAVRSRQELPAGVLAIAPQVERDRAITVTRAYRVNLNMLALVALWTGAFLVFSTQSLSVLRRRRSLALLRALGVTRGQLQRALIGEGAALGVAGSLLGVILGLAFAARRTALPRRQISAMASCAPSAPR